MQKSTYKNYWFYPLTGTTKKIFYSNLPSLKRVKYLRINLNKELKDLYSEDDKIPVKEVEEDIDKWKAIPYLWTGRINVVNCPYYAKRSTNSMQTFLKISMTFSQNLKKTNLKSCGKHKSPQIAKTTLRNKNEAGCITISDFKLYCKLQYVIKTMWFD